jgi:hypothetical protein
LERTLQKRIDPRTILKRWVLVEELPRTEGEGWSADCPTSWGPRLDDSEMRAQLEGLFRKIMRVPDDGSLEAQSPRKVPTWDSLRNVELLVACQRSFSIRFTAREFSAEHTFLKLVEGTT